MWKVVENYIKNNPLFLSDHQLLSYKDFCQGALLETLKTKVKCDAVKCVEPDSEALASALREGATYCSRIFTVEGRDETFLCTLPKLTDEGCFIIGGLPVFLPILETLYEPEWSSSPTLKVTLQGITVAFVPDTETEERGDIIVQVPGLDASIPLFVLMRALGATSDKSICEHCTLGDVSLQDKLRPSVHASGQIYTIQSARAFIHSLGACGWLQEDAAAKAYQIGYLVRQLLRMQAGKTAPCTADHHQDKAVHLCGTLLEMWLKDELDLFLERKPKDKPWESYCAADELGQAILKRFPEPCEPLNFFARTARVREVTTVGDRLHASHWGIYDAVEHSENKKQLALLTRVTRKDVNLEPVLKALPLLPLTGASPLEHGGMVRVLLNGLWTASTLDPGEVVKQLSAARKAPVKATPNARAQRSAYEDMNYNWDPLAQEIHIRTTAGRVQRPLFFVDETGRLSCDEIPNEWTWADPGVVEYADCAETASLLIALDRAALTKHHTHLEVHNSLLLGARTNLVACLPEHTPAANLFTLAAVSGSFIPAEKLTCAETPLLCSGYYSAAKAVQPFGMNVVVAVCSYGSDGKAFLLNQSAVDRGLFQRKVQKTFVCKAGCNVEEKDAVRVGDVLADNVVSDVEGTVQSVHAGIVTVEYLQSPSMGDRFAARNGEVYICGGMLPESDMPFSQQGLRPDVIIPPSGDLSMPSLLLEGIINKTHLLQGSLVDCTAFNHPTSRADLYVSELQRRGIKSLGEEVLYHGVTGAVIRTPLFVAPLYLSPLEREVQTFEATGVASVVTRQPLRGELFDETARDACIAHGMAATLQDALVRRSDGEGAFVDDVSGLFATDVVELGVKVAPTLDGPLAFDGALALQPCPRVHKSFRRLKVPHAFRVLAQELAMANVQMRMVTLPPTMSDLEMEQVRGFFRSMVAITPEVLANAFAAAFDRAECFDPVWRSVYPPTKQFTLFPFISSADWLKSIVATSLDITPTADMRPATFNAAKLDSPAYASMDWRAARHTLKYCFEKMNSGVFVRIRHNRVVNFDPICSDVFANDFLHRLTLDKKEAATPEALRVALRSQHPAQWSAVGHMLRLGKGPSDGYLAQVYDMLVETCSHRAVQDCFFIVNRTDHPILGTDATEPFEAFYGPEKKLDPGWKAAFIPVLSQCSSPKHADVPIPTGDDWEAISGKQFASYNKTNEVKCGNRYPNMPAVNWSDRTATVELETARKLPVFFWSGEVVVGDDKHPTVLLGKAAKDYAQKGRRVDLMKSGVLQVRDEPASKSRVYVSFDPSTKLVVVHPRQKKSVADESAASSKSLSSYANKYKFIFNVERNGAALDFGALLKHGFCVLNVESAYELWFEPFLRGGDATEYQEDWCYLKIKRDMSNLDHTVEWCIENDDKCRRIAENGRRFFDAYLTKAYVYDYLSTTLNSISSRQRVTDLTPEEEIVRTKDVKGMYGKALLPVWSALPPERNAAVPLHTIAVVAVYRGPHQLDELKQFLQHYQSRNVLVVKASSDAPRGALFNAAAHFIQSNASDVTTIVFLDFGARFRPEFAKAFFAGASDKGIVDFGRLVAMPIGWAIKFTLEAFKACNGFPNTFGGDENAEAAAVLERFYRNRKTWTCYYPDTNNDILTSKPPEPKKTDLTPAGEALVLLDRIHWKIDGLNTIQYKITEHVEGDWTQTPATSMPNLRTVTIHVTPQSPVNAIPTQAPAPSEIPYPKPLNLATTVEVVVKQETVATPAGVDELPPNIEIVVDGHSNGIKESLPNLENTQSLSQSNAESTKIISFQS